MIPLELQAILQALGGAQPAAMNPEIMQQLPKTRGVPIAPAFPYEKLNIQQAPAGQELPVIYPGTPPIRPTSPSGEAPVDLETLLAGINPEVMGKLPRLLPPFAPSISPANPLPGQHPGFAPPNQFGPPFPPVIRPDSPSGSAPPGSPEWLAALVTETPDPTPMSPLKSRIENRRNIEDMKGIPGGPPASPDPASGTPYEMDVAELSSALGGFGLNEMPSEMQQQGAVLNAAQQQYNNEKGIIEPGNITDLSSRPTVKLSDGEIGTVKSFSINENGIEVLIPQIVDGKLLSQQEAIKHYQETGEHLGKFDTPENATKFSKELSDKQGKSRGMK